MEINSTLRKFSGLMVLAIVIGISGCSEVTLKEQESVGLKADVADNVANLDLQDTVQIRWTEYGIPHVRANSWEGLGYGFAHAFATNTICVLAREFITVRGEQAKYFGATEENINQDAFYRALLNQKKLEDYLAYGSPDSKEMDLGYVRGYNDFITSQRGMLPESCNNASWINPISIRDLARISLGVGIRYGLGRVANEIVAAEHGLDVAKLMKLDFEIDGNTIGSNALGFGAKLTESGRGVLMGNPHYPWHGPSRFHMIHLTYPGEIDVMGAGLISSSRIAIGFTEHVAWSHTVSTALRFTMFQLELMPDNPLAYRLGEDVFDIEVIEVEVETPDGVVNRTVHMTHLGPVVAGREMPWTDEKVYVMRDVNYENYRSADQYQSITKARNVEELREALATHQGAAFVNTVAADSNGGVLYADMSAIPNVSGEQIERCSIDLGNPRIITLNGSDPDCNWQIDPAAAYPGLMPPSDQPSLITNRYVSNSNDSYWLSNPDNRLEGFSPIIGDEKTARSLRTRAGLVMVEEIIRNGEKFTQSKVKDLLFNHRHYAAELVLDDILEVCEGEKNLEEACMILADWDRRQDIDSVGAHIFNQVWEKARGLSAHFSIPFDLDDPVNTPTGLPIDDEEIRALIINALESSVISLQEAGIPLDAPWGDVQFAMRNGTKIGLPGGSGGQGLYSVITARFNADSGGYTPIIHGNSYIQTVTWDESGVPDADAILTYSQSPEPDSPYYSDMTELYSQSNWVDLPFTEDQIRKHLQKEEILQL